MLYIDDTLDHIQFAKTQHEKLIACYLTRRIFGNNRTSLCADKSCKICNSAIKKANVNPYIINILEQLNIPKIAAGEPSELFAIQEKFNQLYFRNTKRKKISREDHIQLQLIFNYTWFTNKKNDFYNAYDFLTI